MVNYEASATEGLVPVLLTLTATKGTLTFAVGETVEDSECADLGRRHR